MLCCVLVDFFPLCFLVYTMSMHSLFFFFLCIRSEILMHMQTNISLKRTTLYTCDHFSWQRWIFCKCNETEASGPLFAQLFECQKLWSIFGGREYQNGNGKHFYINISCNFPKRQPIKKERI